MSVINQLFRMVSVWRDFNQNQLIETYQLKNHIDLHRLRLNQISKQNSEHKKAGGVLGFWGKTPFKLFRQEILRFCQ